MKIAELHSLYLDCNAACTDTRTVKHDDMFFALKGDNFDANAFAKLALDAGANYAVIDNPKYYINDKTILVEDVLTCLQNLASFHRSYLNIPVIALTGSNGKTTSKELINAVLEKKFKTKATKGNLNNHIGVPLTLLSFNKTTEIGIVEMGANHLNEIAFLCTIAKPNYGYITNFGKAHLEGFGSLEGVIKGKTELYDYLKTNNGLVFVNAKDNKQIELSIGINNYSFGDNNTSNKTVTITLQQADPFVTVSYNNVEIKSQLIGSYNFTNISAAIAIGNYFKVTDQQIKEAIASYTPSNNRSQIINKDTNKIILDAYNANPTSMRAALESFSSLKDSNKTAILGDMFELGSDAAFEHQNIIDLVSQLKIDKIIVIGKLFYNTTTAADKIKKFETFEDFKSTFNLTEINNTSVLIKASRGMKLERILELE